MFSRIDGQVGHQRASLRRLTILETEFRSRVMANQSIFHRIPRPLLFAAILLALLALSIGLAVPAGARSRQNSPQNGSPSNDQQAPSAEQAPANGQPGPTPEPQMLPDHQQALAPEVQPVDLVRTAVANEIKDDDEAHLYSWKERKKQKHDGYIVEHDVQTPEGPISRVILIDGRPLDAEQQKAEQERLRKSTDPEQMSRSLKDRRDDEARTRRMLNAIPDAFNFTYLKTETAPNGHRLVTFRFTPNPGFNPPNRETMVFTGMNGDVVVDTTAMRLMKVDGTLFKDVNFGWGIFGRLYSGGRFLVENCEITPTHWDTARMYLHFDGKIMLFKGLHIESDETYWDYQPVQPMTVAQAVEMLNREDSSQKALATRGSASKYQSETRKLSNGSSLGVR